MFRMLQTNKMEPSSLTPPTPGQPQTAQNPLEDPSLGAAAGMRRSWEKWLLHQMSETGLSVSPRAGTRSETDRTEFCKDLCNGLPSGAEPQLQENKPVSGAAHVKKAWGFSLT